MHPPSLPKDTRIAATRSAAPPPAFGSAAIHPRGARRGSLPVASSVRDPRKAPLQLPPKLTPNRNDPLLGGRSERLGGESDPHPVAHLSCHDHGGPSNREIVDSMVFWSDVPSDADYLSPMHPLRDPNTDDNEERYLTFEPDHGGWNNIRMAMAALCRCSEAKGTDEDRIDVAKMLQQAFRRLRAPTKVDGVRSEGVR
ncbi:hypothetical protein ACHAWF_007679 [Thalassiosira exigua]